MKITVAGALRVITTQGKTNGTISRCIFEDTAIEARQGIFVEILAGNGNAMISSLKTALLLIIFTTRYSLFFTTFRRCIFRDNFGIQQAGHVYCAYGTGGVDLLNCSLFSNKKDVTISNMATSKTGTFIYSESAGSLKLVNTSMMSMVTNRNTYPVFDIVSGGFLYKNILVYQLKTESGRIQLKQHRRW